MAKIKYVQFYADKENCYSNKLFSFPVENIKSAFRVLLKFSCAGNYFRYIYLKTTTDTRDLENEIQTALEDYKNFFNNYDSNHFPTLGEAWNDFQIYKM